MNSSESQVFVSLVYNACERLKGKNVLSFKSKNNDENKIILEYWI